MDIAALETGTSRTIVTTDFGLYHFLFNTARIVDMGAWFTTMQVSDISGKSPLIVEHEPR
jgi:hypothetical protein